MADHRHHDRGHGHGHHAHEEQEKLHPDVEKFLVRMREALVAKQLEVLSDMYEIELPSLTDAHFRSEMPNMRNARGKPNMVNRHWPHVNAVKHLFKNATPQVEQVYALHQIRSQAYKENLKNRSWDLHGDALKTFVGTEAQVDLPNGWAWDIVDEFVYQLGQSRTFRRKIDPAQGPQQQQPQPVTAGGWSVSDALARLEEVVARTNIKAILDEVAKGKRDAAEVVAPGDGHLRRILGYSALVGIVKIRVLLGDFHGALEAAEPLLLRAQGPVISIKIPPLHATLYFHVGFAYFMLRRYADAIVMLQQVMNVRSQRKFFDSLQGPVVRLIILAGILGDTPAPDYSGIVAEKFKLQDDDQILLAQGDLDRYREVFVKCAPKFFSAADPTQNPTETGHETKELQLNMFLRSVTQQLCVLKLRGYLTTYSTLAADKIGSLLNREATQQSVESHLVCMKRHTRQCVRTMDKRLAEGEIKRVSTVDVIAENGTITVHKNAELPTLAAAFFDRLIALKAAKPVAPKLQPAA